MISIQFEENLKLDKVKGKIFYGQKLPNGEWRATTVGGVYQIIYQLLASNTIQVAQVLLLVSLNHSQLWTMSSEMVDRINWLLSITLCRAVPPKHHLLSINEHYKSRVQSVGHNPMAFRILYHRIAYAAISGINIAYFVSYLASKTPAISNMMSSNMEHDSMNTVGKKSCTKVLFASQSRKILRTNHTHPPMKNIT